jgi:large subunit ribosomal protein L36e
MSSSGIAVGLKKGYPVTKRAQAVKPSRGKGRLSKRTKLVRSLVSEVCGMAPYEKRLLDMLKTGGAASEKKMYKFAKKRLGSHSRALAKRDQVKDLYGAIRARAAMQ